MMGSPQKEHEWLQQFVGEWTYEVAAQGPEGEFKSTGSESVRSLGGMWILAEGRGGMPDGDTATTVLTLGYDPALGRYVGTWIGSMMPLLWVYDASMDDSGRILNLDADGPAMSGEGTARYRDAHEIVSPDHRIMRAHLRQDDGSWKPFMEVHYRRK